MKIIIEIKGGGDKEDFLKFIKKNPDSETAKEYNLQMKSENCIPLENFPDIAEDIIMGYVADEDVEEYLEQECDYDIIGVDRGIWK